MCVLFIGEKMLSNVRQFVIESQRAVGQHFGTALKVDCMSTCTRKCAIWNAALPSNLQK